MLSLAQHLWSFGQASFQLFFQIDFELFKTQVKSSWMIGRMCTQSRWRRTKPLWKKFQFQRLAWADATVLIHEWPLCIILISIAQILLKRLGPFWCNVWWYKACTTLATLIGALSCSPFALSANPWLTPQAVQSRNTRCNLSRWIQEKEEKIKEEVSEAWGFGPTDKLEESWSAGCYFLGTYLK